jgi:hypothetical protein
MSAQKRALQALESRYRRLFEPARDGVEGGRFAAWEQPGLAQHSGHRANTSWTTMKQTQKTKEIHQ